jgi:hypothetical protein
MKLADKTAEAARVALLREQMSTAAVGAGKPAWPCADANGRMRGLPQQHVGALHCLTCHGAAVMICSLRHGARELAPLNGMQGAATQAKQDLLTARQREGMVEKAERQKRSERLQREREQELAEKAKLAETVAAERVKAEQAQARGGGGGRVSHAGGGNALSRINCCWWRWWDASQMQPVAGVGSCGD